MEGAEEERDGDIMKEENTKCQFLITIYYCTLYTCSSNLNCMNSVKNVLNEANFSKFGAFIDDQITNLVPVVYFEKNFRSISER